MAAWHRTRAVPRCWWKARARRTSRDGRASPSLRLRGRPMQIAAARLADHLVVLADELAAQEGGFHPRGELDAFEWRIALRGFGILCADGPGLGGIDERDVGVQALGDVAFRVESEAARRVVARQSRHAVVGKAA